MACRIISGLPKIRTTSDARQRYGGVSSSLSSPPHLSLRRTPFTEYRIIGFPMVKSRNASQECLLFPPWAKGVGRGGGGVRALTPCDRLSNMGPGVVAAAIKRDALLLPCPPHLCSHRFDMAALPIPLAALAFGLGFCLFWVIYEAEQALRAAGLGQFNFKIARGGGGGVGCPSFSCPFPPPRSFLFPFVAILFYAISPSARAQLSINRARVSFFFFNDIRGGTTYVVDCNVIASRQQDMYVSSIVAVVDRW
ncbi:hypothetical protein LX32DRAFT_180791 [Colletotrichum zoysiae]|uniref:Uncharacterized protein n=1 Tax=Colletotrichum zoysiae TaxID=1216348 RepID=A0AAD9HPD4_9PEZI|nr:hypothetical protein LX32DRAFT_180791 [Colletotrichum zoysiae]